MKHALALLAICVSSSAGLAHDFKCFGTEPFWDLTINDRQIRYSTPGSSSELTPTQPTSARGMAEDYVLVYRTRTATGSKEPVTIVLQKSVSSECSDGMSDFSYPYYGVLVSDREVLAGCCRKGD